MSEPLYIDPRFTESEGFVRAIEKKMRTPMQSELICKPLSDCCNARVNNYRGEYSAFGDCEKCGESTTVHEGLTTQNEPQLSAEERLIEAAELEDSLKEDPVITELEALYQPKDTHE